MSVQRWRLVDPQGYAEYAEDEAGPWVAIVDHIRIVAALQAALEVMAARVGEQSDQIDRLESELKQARMGDDF